MIGKSPDRHQRELFRPLLPAFIEMTDDLVLQGQKIDWSYFEREFASLYSNTGQPTMPVRLMVGCLVLKQLYNLGDETLALFWKRSPYMQYFCGEAYSQHKFPFEPSDFVQCRHRIGVEGVEKMFSHSVTLHGTSRN